MIADFVCNHIAYIYDNNESMPAGFTWRRRHGQFPRNKRATGECTVR